MKIYDHALLSNPRFQVAKATSQREGMAFEGDAAAFLPPRGQLTFTVFFWSILFCVAAWAGIYFFIRGL